MRFRGVVEATTAVFAAILLACAFTYPYIINFTNAGRLDTNDGRWSIWVVAWVAHALTTNPFDVYQANIYHPHQNALAFSEGNLVEGAIAIPAWLATKNPYATHNFFFLACFVLSGVATYYLVRYLTGDRRAAAVAGVLFAYCPFVFARQAHSQLLMIGFLPWCMLAFHRLMERTTVGRAVELGVVLWLTGLACAYYGIFAGGMVALGTIMFAITRHHWKEPRYWGAIACAAVVCIGLTLPLFMPYLDMQQRTGFTRTLDDARAYSANAGAWLASSAWAHRWWLPYLQRPYMQDFSEVLFPGILPVIFGLAGWWIGGRRVNRPLTLPDEPLPSRLERDVVWFYALAGVLAFWISLGPRYGLYTFLHNTIPVFSFLRAPARTGIVVTLCLVVLAAVAMIRLMKGPRGRAVAAVLFVLAVADQFRAPLRMREAPPLPRAYDTLARLPKGPVIELPYWYERLAYPRHAEYMLASTYHWQPLVNGYSDHIPQDFRDTALPLSSFPSRESFAILEQLGARYAVFHLDLMDPRTREKTIERIESEYAAYLRPLEKNGEVWLFEIVGWPR
jgi:hypothetical protein